MCCKKVACNHFGETAVMGIPYSNSGLGLHASKASGSGEMALPEDAEKCNIQAAIGREERGRLKDLR